MILARRNGSMQDIQLNFNENAVLAVNVILAVLIFGVALSIRLQDFQRLLHLPRAPLVGAVSQFLIMPALTFLITWALNTPAGIALGLLIVAACPGGNLSNVMTHLARGSTALSIGMTGISTLLALVLTPINIAFWGSMRMETSALLSNVALDPVGMATSILLVLVLPLISGMAFAAHFPAVANKLHKPVRLSAFLFFGLSIVGAFAANWQQFLQFAGLVFGIIAIQNLVAFLGGYLTAKAVSLKEADARAVAIETGIQNAGIAIIIMFSFFGGRGDMLLVGAGVGAYQIASGTLLAWLWSLKSPDDGDTSSAVDDTALLD